MRYEPEFDIVVDHHEPDAVKLLVAACPPRIDIYFKSVGGHVWDAVFPLLKDFAHPGLQSHRTI